MTSPGRNIRIGRALLAAAWGFASGLGYASFFGHLRIIDQPDVGLIPQLWLTVIIGLGWGGTIVAMLATAVATPPAQPD